MMPDYDPRKQFIDKFFSFGGLADYYQQLAQMTNKEEHKTAAKALQQTADVYIPQLMKYYTCDPSWPICLYDFTHRNLNPKFNTLRVAKPLTSYVREGYFSKAMLSNRQISAFNAPEDHLDSIRNRRNTNSGRKLSNELVDEGDLVIQRSMHLCSMDPQHKQFQTNFKARYDALDQSLFNNDKVRFDVDDELDAIEKACLFVADVC